MKIKEIVEKFGLEVKSAPDQLDNEVIGGYASDLLSDVMAHSKVGNIWITLQTHQNIVAVATLKELSGIIITNNRNPEEETQKRAEEERIPIMVTNLSSFEVVGRLYQSGITGA